MRSFVAVSILALFSGCAQIDDTVVRTTTMNFSISEADNKSTLLNLARASLAEPLTFASMSGYDGHQGATAGIQVPNLTVVAGNVTQYTTPGNMAGLSASTDFHYLAANDNATYSALLQPIDPATVGYFLRQEYPRELLFFLIVSKIRVTQGGVTQEYNNSGVTKDDLQRYPRGERPFEKFGSYLESLLDSGLTAQVDISSTRRSKLCFDRKISRIYVDGTNVKPSLYQPTCAEAKPIISPTKDDKLAALPPFSDAYTFYDSVSGAKVEMYFRSTFGIYRYLGRLMALQNDLPVLLSSVDNDPTIITVTDQDSDCFVKEVYRGRMFCVPNRANTTKRVFSLLHDLVKLYTVSTDKPVTLTTRLIQ